MARKRTCCTRVNAFFYLVSHKIILEGRVEFWLEEGEEEIEQVDSMCICGLFVGRKEIRKETNTYSILELTQAVSNC
jgi:hypothetical protein